jgi:hypothetical protein
MIATSAAMSRRNFSRLVRRWATIATARFAAGRYGDCTARADQRGLHGDARADFIGWCVDRGAAYNDVVGGRYNDCYAETNRRGLRGDERNDFMDACVNRDKSVTASNDYWDKYRDCYARATDKGFHDRDRRQYIESCVEHGSAPNDLFQSYQACFQRADERHPCRRRPR